MTESEICNATEEVIRLTKNPQLKSELGFQVYHPLKKIISANKKEWGDDDLFAWLDSLCNAT